LTVYSRSMVKYLKSGARRPNMELISNMRSVFANVLSHETIDTHPANCTNAELVSHDVADVAVPHREPCRSQ
jgi:hypothetical protein